MIALLPWRYVVRKMAIIENRLIPELLRRHYYYRDVFLE